MANGLPAVTDGWQLLALVEVSNFGPLRRLLGRAKADALVETVAGRAREATGAVASRTIGRGLIELELVGASLGLAEERLDRLDAAFAGPVMIDGEAHTVELVVAAAGSGGAAGFADSRLAEVAEEALVTAREERRRVVLDADQTSTAEQAASLRRELALAIAREQVFLQYQPKLHVRRQEVASAEALVRWNHPSRGLIYPGDFIGMAEQSGLIGPLTLWTLRRVIADQRTLRLEGHDLPIFINISGQLLCDSRFIAEACAIIAEGDSKIGFEITETSMIGDPQSAIRHLNIVAKHGVPIAIDDYGAGLSSLAYLKQLPATELKIDKMFVMELTSSHRDPLIVRSTIDLAHAMEMEVTAEGVETPAALALLSVMGCDLVQGFLLSRPLSLDAFQQYLARDAGLPLANSGYGFRKSPMRSAS